MTNKREHPENQYGEDSLYNKRSRLNKPEGSDDLLSSSQSRIDPTYGQHGAFPGLDDSHVDDELFYRPASDGLEYLRMVRSEAKTVPNLLVAPTSPIVQCEKNNLYADYPQGYYSNGAYTATPLPSSEPRHAYTNASHQEDQDLQEAYYTSLCARFREVTEILHSAPTRAAADRTEVCYLDWTKPRLWRGRILDTTPTMVLLAQLTQESVICGLEVLESLLTLANLRGQKGKNIGAWTWGLLGRCRDVGQMGSEEVGVLRNLGKQAVWLLRRIDAGEVIGGAVDEPDVVAVDEDEEEGEGKEGEEGEEGEEDERKGGEERVGDGVDFLAAADADDGYAPDIDHIAAAVLGHERNGEDHPIPKPSDAELVNAKQHILDSLGTNQAQTDSLETNATNQDGMKSPTPTYRATDLNVDGEGGLKAGTDNTKQHIHNSRGTNQAQTGSTEINASNQDGIKSPTLNYPVTDLEVDVEGGPEEGADEKSVIHATLDMLVTIIGELYGQRDLLNGRLLWDEMH